MKGFKIENNVNRSNLFGNVLINPADVVLTSGTATFVNDTNNTISSKSLKVNVGSYQTTDVVFNFANQFLYTTKNDFAKFFSFGIKSDTAFTLIANVIINGAVPVEMECDVEAGIENFQTFAQHFGLVDGDTFNFTLKVPFDAGAPSNTFSFFIDGFMLESNVYGNYFPKGFILPNNDTGYQSRVDESNIVSLTTSIENTVVITGAVESNGGLVLLDSNSKVTPINTGDVVQVDFACTFVTPAGADQYVDVKFIVDGVVYRSMTHQLLKGSGNDDTFSISWCVPVGADFKLNGGVVSINPTSTMNYKNRYLQATRIHKAR